MSHPLDGAFQRIDRAEKHLAELKGHIETFRQEYLNATTISFDPDPPYHARVWHPTIKAPSNLVSIIIGEILYSLRSALDYLIFELARHDAGAVQDRTQFPICDTPEKFTRNVPRRLKGISVAHVAAIEGLQPYKGTTWTSVLQYLSNPDKHRELTPRGAVFLIEVLQPGSMFIPAHNPRTAKRRAKRPDGCEVEVQLVGTVEITVPVAMHASGIAIGDHAEETMEKLILKVRETLEAFKPEF